MQTCGFDFSGFSSLNRVFSFFRSLVTSVLTFCVGNGDIGNNPAISLSIQASNSTNVTPYSVAVFSSKPSHAKRGALFSTYPDNFALGQHLFSMVQDLKYQPEQKNFAALKSTLLAVNLRTAAHLGLKYSSEQKQKFELTFPQ